MRSIENKIDLFNSIFRGLQNVHGTYDPSSGNHYHCNKPVTKKVIYQHLKGEKPYGIYPLIGSKTHFGVLDFDSQDPQPPLELIQRAKHYELEAYLERSKSKGYHVWFFLNGEGIKAIKLRKVMKYLLDEIGCKNIEVFPKHNSTNGRMKYGNFINAPLFGKLVSQGKTVFIKPDLSLKPYSNQWAFLEAIKMISSGTVNSIIEINSLNKPINDQNLKTDDSNSHNAYILPPCIRKILECGVKFDQRVACFRIGVHLKRIGLPMDLAIEVLMKWRLKNKPGNVKQIITEKEVTEQVRWAYIKNYRGYGCDETIIKNFCDSNCKVRK